jgi:hypothetical protein
MAKTAIQRVEQTFKTLEMISIPLIYHMVDADTSGDTMSSCGTARGDDDGFKDYIGNYGAFCLDFKAVK